MKITKAWIKKWDPCGDAVKWCDKQNETDDIKLLKLMIKNNKLDWANWLIVRRMKYKQYVSYAIYAAKQVIDIYEKKYPDDKRPREAINAAKKCLKNNSKKNKNAADAYAAAYAAYAAYAAAYAASAAYAAYAAAYAAYAAAAAAAAAYTADAYAAATVAAAAVYTADAYAADAYAADADYADYADYAAVRKKMKLKILKYGVKLLEEGKINE